MRSVYLNQSGTSWPKPECVRRACQAALDASVEDWPQTFAADHRTIAEFFGVSDLSRLLLTPGCTSALNVAVSDLPLSAGDRILTSSWEHHALHRPLLKWVERGVELKIIPPTTTGPFDLDRFEEAVRADNVRLVAVTAASNATGEILPIEQISSIAHRAGKPVLVDGAQLAGWLDLDLERLNIDLFAFAGHKALHGPWGIGGLYVDSRVRMQSPQAVCDIARPGDCESMPGYCDVGSVDRIALAGLAEALKWLDRQPDRLRIARERVERIRQTLEARSDAILYGTQAPCQRLPVVAFNLRGQSADEVAARLAERGIRVAGGMQCAPLAHEVLGSGGAARISVGPGNSDQDIDRACEVLESLS